VGGIITVVLLITGIFANFFAPYGMNESIESAYMVAPGAQFILGTDHLGRDMLSRIIYGARISMTIGVSATLLSICVSTLIGIVSGFFGGKIDMVTQRFVDAWMCFPGLVMLIALVSLIGAGLWQVIIVLAFQFGIAGSRIVRSAVIGIKENVFVSAAEAIGCSHMKTLVRHILPNVLAPIIILFTTRVPAIIMAEASLSFLGFGVPPPQPSWGGMLSMEARRFMYQAPWMAIWPGLCLALVVYGVNMFGDAIRDLLDPRLRGGVGRYGGGAAEKGRKKAIAKLSR
jgi:peptide/nickel transport system permease protein